MKVRCSGSSIASHPGLLPSRGSGTKLRKGKIRRLVKIERRAGSVTIASGNARLNRSPRAASEFTAGVWIWGDP